MAWVLLSASGERCFVSRMRDFFDHIFAYYDLLLPLGLDETPNRHKMWLNNAQCGHSTNNTNEK